jgi:hypothetical protein
MDERKVDVAMLYDKNKVEVIDSETITFFFEIINKNTGNYDTTRDVLFSKLNIKRKLLMSLSRIFPLSAKKISINPKETLY